jgi:hypothetical protein
MSQPSCHHATGSILSRLFIRLLQEARQYGARHLIWSHSLLCTTGTHPHD